MIDIIIIMTDAGLPIFNWQPEEIEIDGDLISGFLSAINMFAKGERGEQIKKITLDPTTFLFEKEKELIFVILTRDQEFEKSINLILPEIKKRFLTQFSNEIEHFHGNIEYFKPFYSMTENILASYGYFDYIQIKSSFETDDELKAVLFLDKITGDVLYIKSKEYLDRNTLSFQSIILLKSIDRVISEILEKIPIISIIISPSHYLIIKKTDKIAIIQEKKYPLDNKITDLKINEKKIREFLKKPGKILFESKEKFLFFDQWGKNQISNDLIGQFKGGLLSPDCITLINTSKNIIEQIYRDNLFATLIFSEDSLYAVFPISDYFTFMQISTEDFPNIKPLLGNIKKCKSMNSTNLEDFNQILQKISKFKSFFT
ncbi:MAG: hypothetical protein ACFFD2_07675 [Promethearchaeota archaeon]